MGERPWQTSMANQAAHCNAQVSGVLLISDPRPPKCYMPMSKQPLPHIPHAPLAHELHHLFLVRPLRHLNVLTAVYESDEHRVSDLQTSSLLSAAIPAAPPTILTSAMPCMAMSCSLSMGSRSLAIRFCSQSSTFSSSSQSNAPPTPNGPDGRAVKVMSGSTGCQENERGKSRRDETLGFVTGGMTGW